MSARATCGCGWTGTYASPARAEAMSAKHVCKTDAGVRRATRRYRCGRCGLEAVYENAGATEARYWFGRHSCRKRELAMLRTAMAEAQRALVDRTPKPCLHKVADHQCGTRAKYVLDRCRCTPCSAANSKAETWRERQKAYGRYNKYVPALPVREHVQLLRDSGMGLKTIAKRAGIGTGTISKLIYGVYAPGTYPHRGRNGKGDLIRPPSRRVLRATAERLYAIDLDWNAVREGQRRGVPRYPPTASCSGCVPSLPSGWSQRQLAARLEIQRGNFYLVTGCWQITARTRRRACDLYDELSMTLPPTGNRWQQAARARSKAYAAERGWLPPLALDDDRLDDSGYEPWYEQHDDDDEPQEAFA